MLHIANFAYQILGEPKAQALKHAAEWIFGISNATRPLVYILAKFQVLC